MVEPFTFKNIVGRFCHPARWQQTDEARDLLSRVRAQERRAASFEKQARILGTNGGNSRSVHESFQHEHHRTECPKSLSTTGQVGKKPVMADDIYTTDKIPSMKMEGSFSVL